MKWRTLVVISVTFFILLVLGGLGFRYLEYNNEQEEIEQYKAYLQEFLADQPCVTEQKLSELVERVVHAYDHGVLHSSAATYTTNWDLAGSMFFASAVATTIGYGNVSPVTYGGRMFCVLFGIISIPICLVMLAAIGRKIKKAVHVVDAKLVHRLDPCKERWMGRSFQTILICMVGVLVFMILPSVVFMVVEDWEYRDAMYYTFTTLTTIGFGDYVAGSSPTQAYHSVYRLGTGLWIVLGLAWLSTVISLVQDVVQNLVKKVDQKVTNGYEKSRTYNKGEVEEYPDEIMIFKYLPGLFHRSGHGQSKGQGQDQSRDEDHVHQV